MEKKGKRYSNEFRTEAVELARNIGITKACEDLGISQASLARWRVV